MNPSSRTCRSKSLFKKTCLSVLVALALGANAHAQQPAQAAQYEVPAGDLTQVVNQISRSSGVQIVYDIELLRGKRAAEVRGAMTLEQALDRALSGSGLGWKRVNATTVSIQKKAEPKRGARDRASTLSREQAAQGNEVKDLEDVVVVGSRLGSSPVESAMPIKVITRDQIDRSGAGNIAQVLSYLSEVSVNSNGDRPIGVGDGLRDGANTNSTTVQMRGMPRGTTLVLINGRRAGESATYYDSGQFDLSSIPLSLVERVEVLPAGSSAIYGGDGLAGVINVVLRRDANGLETRFRQSHADGYRARQAGVLWGKTWSRADVTLAVSWSDEEPLYSSERSLTADQDYSRFGGRDRRGDSGYPPTVYSLDGCPTGFCSSDIWQRGNLPGLDSPVAVVPAGSNGIGLTPADFAATQGQISRSSRQRNLRSAEESFGASFNGRLDIGASTEAFMELSHTKRAVPAYEMPLTTFLPHKAYLFSRVPGSNPFNPFGVDVAVGFNFVNTGVFTAYDQSYSRGAFGLHGKNKHFDWEVSSWRVVDKSETTGAMFFDEEAVISAINAVDPAAALNPFVSNGEAPGSPELMQSLVHRFDGMTQSETTGFSGHVRGQPLRLPAGSVTALVGVDYQRQSFSLDTNGASFAYPHVSGETSSTAYFAEARIPLMQPESGSSLEKMAATAALRRESSSRFSKAATTETIGFEWRPSDEFLVRATYSTAFRPILNYHMMLAPSYRNQQVSDPLRGGENYYVRIRQGGGAPTDLTPESSDNSTVGFIYRPNNNWSLSATHWDMEFTDRISYTSIQSILNEEAFRPGRVTRDPDTGIIKEVDGRQVNIALMSAAGVDIGLDGMWETGAGEFHASLTATYTYEHEQKSTPKSPVYSGLGKLSSPGWAPRWKIVPKFGWDHGSARAFLVGRYISKYEDSERFSSGPRIGERNMLGDFWMFDLNINLAIGQMVGGDSWLSGSNLTLGSTNLFDRLPDFCVGCYEAGYDASQYDIMGRTIYTEFRLSF